MPGEALAHLHSKGAFPGFDVWKEEKAMTSMRTGAKIQIGEWFFIWNDGGSTIGLTD